MRICQGCGASFVKGETVCPYCGTSLLPGQAGEPQQPPRQEKPPFRDWDFSAAKDAFRPRGKTQQQEQQPPPLNIFNKEKNANLISGLLGIALGTFGAHWFYRGNSRRGIVYCLFCWTGIPTILGIVEGIGFLRRSDLFRLPE